ncbi:hypothetical protein FAVG1_11882 [Fusarium avenaceum]|nr:hypothetical protein FAVG1_11882 [Fusarium avenaceum]
MTDQPSKRHGEVVVKQLSESPVDQLDLEERLKTMERLLQQALQSKGAGDNEEQLPINVVGDQAMLMQMESTSPSPSPQHGLLSATAARSNSGLPNDGMDFSKFTLLPTTPWAERVGEMPHVKITSLSSMGPTNISTTEMILQPLSLPTFHQLPSKGFALELITDGLKSFNTFFPIFDETDLLQKFHAQYLDSTPNDPCWWSCINVFLAIAHRFRSMRTYDRAYETKQACGYIHNALAVVAELNVMHSNLAAVQSLVGLAIVLQGTANPHPASVLTAAAIRLAQTLGLHRETPYDCLPKDQVEQGRRVFWLAYILDKDISLRMKQPFAQDDEDMDAILPSRNALQIAPPDGLSNTDLLNSRIGLAVIQGQVYKRLYSVQAARQPEAQRQEVARELNSILSYWKSSVDIDFEDGVMVPLQPPLATEMMHSLIHRFTYVNCLVMINVHIPETDSFLVDDLSQIHSIFEQAYVTESRKAAQLISLIPHGDYAVVWLLLQSFSNIAETLLKNAERYPASPQAITDLELVKPFLGLFEILETEKACYRSEEVRRIRRSCDELWDRATEAVRSMNIEFGE